MKLFYPHIISAYLIPVSVASAITKGVRKMCGKIYFPFVSLVLLSTLVVAQEWWETKPYMQWSLAEVDEVLNDSPWVGLNTAPGGTNAFYRLRFLTARPIREALLRRLVLGGLKQVTIDSRKYKPLTEKEILEIWIASRPDDLRVKSDDQHIVIGLTLSIRVFSRLPSPYPDESARKSFPDLFERFWIEEPYVDELSNIDSSKLISLTTLATNSKTAALVRFDPPGSDMLGGKFYFPRVLSDGTPLISDGDTELRFETRIDEVAVKVKFDLRKMLYNGKLEI